MNFGFDKSESRHGIGGVLDNVFWLSVLSHIRSINQEGKLKTKNKDIEINSGKQNKISPRLADLSCLWNCGVVGALGAVNADAWHFS